MAAHRPAPQLTDSRIDELLQQLKRKEDTEGWLNPYDQQYVISLIAEKNRRKGLNG